MKQKTVIALIILLGATCRLSAQTIQLYFPRFAGQEYDFFIFQGSETDTLQSGVIPEDGRVVLSVPGGRMPYAPTNYRGMGRWLLKNGGGLDFVVNGENFSAHCTEPEPNEENIIYKNSREKAFLFEKYYCQQAIFQKMDFIQMGLNAYKEEPDNPLHPLLLSEKEKQEKAFLELTKEMIASPLYAARFRRISNFLNALPLYNLNTGNPDSQLKDRRRFIEEELDPDALYTSGLWRDLISQTAAIYEDENDYIKAMMACLERTKSQTVYLQLAEDLIAICEQYGWQEQEERLIYYLNNKGRITEPTGKLKQLMTLFKLAKGSKAPAFSQGKLSKGRVLLVFYESGCGPCENEMQQLKGNYALLKEKGYEIVSVSADTDEAVFRNTAESFPWKGKYCDLQGFEGEDFVNYGVIGTPTFYLIDKAGIVQGRYARLSDMPGIKN